MFDFENENLTLRLTNLCLKRGNLSLRYARFDIVKNIIRKPSIIRKRFSNHPKRWEGVECRLGGRSASVTARACETGVTGGRLVVARPRVTMPYVGGEWWLVCGCTLMIQSLEWNRPGYL